MITAHRTRIASTISALVVVGLTLFGLAGPAQAATARTISATATPTTASIGQQVTFSGVLNRSPKGAAVRVQRQSGTSWVTAATTTTTTTTGAYTVKVTLPTNAAAYTYRAFAPATSTLAAASSATITITALRPTKASIGASRTAINAGETTTLGGGVSPFVAGTTVTVQRLDGSTWVNVGTATLSSSGGYARNVTPTATTTYRTAVPRTGFNASTVSPSVTIQVSLASAPTITTTSLPDGDQDLPYSATLTKAGGAGTWALAPGSVLKAGLSLDPSTGVISGTPTGSGTSTFTVTFTETATGLAGSKALTLVISPRPAITTTTLPDAIRGAAYSTTLAKTGKAGTWSAQGLPAGLGINATTGEISGTTYVAVGDYGVYPVFTETSTGRAVLKAFALHVGGTPLAITTDAALPDGHRGGDYTVTFTKVGAAGTWSAIQVPEGFTLDPTTGTLTGTPTVAGLYAVYIGFTETDGGFVYKAFSLRVVEPKITTTTIPDGVTGSAYSVQFAKTGLDGIWELGGFLPEGLGFTPEGLLSGTPTETGDFGFAVTFTEDETGVVAKRYFLLHVQAPGSPTITTASLPNGAIGTAYSATLAANPTGGTWAVTTGSLPVGLSLNPTTGAITGTPVVAENAQFIVTYTQGSTQNTKYLTLTVPPAT
ncbi:MAG: putative Ig domain-containing protein [Propionibacteriales bacterium]|nr:putative Ig domain-containing protein [Propionibacteriales bacterium]